MRKECLLSLKHQKISTVKVIMVSLLFIALLSILRAVYFHHEIKNSMLEDIKSEARILTEYILSTENVSLNHHKSPADFKYFKNSDINRNLYVKYVLSHADSEENRADEVEQKLIDYFLHHQDEKEYFDEYISHGEVMYQYAFPVYTKSETQREKSAKPQAMVSVRISHEKAFKNLYGLILKEIVFSLITIVMMMVLLIFLYKDTKKRINKIDNEANKYAFTDALTGLYNRHYLDDFLEKFTPIQNPEKCFAVLFIDIDDFKNVNDEYGHIVGDCVLKELGKMLQSITRSEDLLCRYGGEEFLIIISQISRDYVLEKAEHIRKNVDEIKLPCKKEKVTISLGMSCGKNYDNINMIIEQADKALYRAKTSGKNCIEIF